MRDLVQGGRGFGFFPFRNGVLIPLVDKDGVTTVVPAEELGSRESGERRIQFQNLTGEQMRRVILRRGGTFLMTP